MWTHASILISLHKYISHIYWKIFLKFVNNLYVFLSVNISTLLNNSIEILLTQTEFPIGRNNLFIAFQYRYVFWKSFLRKLDYMNRTLLMKWWTKRSPASRTFLAKNLQWHYAQFSLQNLGFTCYIFPKIAINNDKINDK